MRIAQIAPLAESVPPRRYGGTERVVSDLTECLVALGHDVTLFASGDSRTRARLVAPCTQALRSTKASPAPYGALHLERVAAMAHEFDLLHFHIDCAPLPIVRRLKTPSLTTMHGRLDLPGLSDLYAEFREAPLVSISNSQRAPLPRAHWLGTVYHGIPISRLRVHEKPGSYLAFLGRISPEKRPDRAIEIATRAGVPLRIAAKVDDADRKYFEREIRPLIERAPAGAIEFLSEIDEAHKEAFLGNARALLFPIDWPEPFGLVMIEAMACGTPVIGFRQGSVPEVVEHGVSGLIVESLDEAVRAVDKVGELSRARCRQAFESRFTVERMCGEYLSLYRKVVR